MIVTALLTALAINLPAQKSDATIGVAAIHLQSGRTFSLHGDDRFPMGSVYKFPIALATLQLVDAGKLLLDEQVTLEPKDFSPGWSPIREKSRGKSVTLTVEELLRHMVELSDNTPCDYMIRRLGTDAINGSLRTLGIDGVRVDREERVIVEHLREKDGVVKYGTDPRDTSTPNAMLKLLVKLAKRDVGLSPKSHALLMKWMTNTKTGMRRIRAAVPEGAVVAHKTGTMPGTTNDVGIITSPDGNNHIAIAIFTARATSPAEHAEDDIAAITRTVYSAFMQ